MALRSQPLTIRFRNVAYSARLQLSGERRQALHGHNTPASSAIAVALLNKMKCQYGPGGFVSSIKEISEAPGTDSCRARNSIAVNKSWLLGRVQIARKCIFFIEL